MYWFWMFWIGMGVLLVFALLCFWQPVIFLVMRNFFLFLFQEIKGSIWALHLKVFGEPANINVRMVPIDAGSVNPEKNGWSYADCPASVWVRRKVNNTTEIEVGTFEEPYTWYCYPCMDFCIGKHSGRIKKIIVKQRYIRGRGQWFRHSCGQTEWPKYFTSVVMAHIEVLKFTQRIRSHHPTLIARIFKQYGENFFQEVQ